MNSVTNIPEDNSSLLINSTVTRPPLVTQNPNSSHPKNTNNNISHHHLSPYSYCNFTSHHTTNLLSLNHHLANIGADGKSSTRASEFIDQQPGLGISSRWNPTPEQLLALEEMYRRGTRTPSAEQIQHIASQLRRFGKIEGKNVFYWFQNHKARERQKRRRREMENNNNCNYLSDDQEMQHNNTSNHNNIPAGQKEPGLRKTSNDMGQTKNWPPSSNSEQQQHRVSDNITACCGPQSYNNGWLQFDQREFQVQQIRKSTAATPTTKIMNATWQEMDQCLPSSLEYNKKLLKLDHQNYNLSGFSLLNNMTKPYNSSYQQQENGEETLSHHQTLELFPLQDHKYNKDDDDDGNSNVNGTKKVPITAAAAINDTNNYSASSFHYIEFLPLKQN